MGRVERKLLRLEASSGERAAARLKELFDSLTDRALVLILADAKGVKLTNEEVQERASAEARLHAGGVEGLLELAVRPENCAGEEEMNRHLCGVIEKAIYPNGRRERLSLLMYELEERRDTR